MMGRLYAGVGVGEDKLTAYMWFDLSASNGNSRAITARDAIAAAMDADEIERPAGGLACQPPGHRDGADAGRDTGNRPARCAMCRLRSVNGLLGRNAGWRDRAEEPRRDPRFPDGLGPADER
jgi:hypothetical protein